MIPERIFNTAGAIIGLATVAVVLGSRNTARIIQVSFNGFTSSIRAATEPAR